MNRKIHFLSVVIYQHVFIQSASATDDHRLAVDIAERTSLALQDYAKTGDIMYILLIQRHLVAVQDDNGDKYVSLIVCEQRNQWNSESRQNV